MSVQSCVKKLQSAMWRASSLPFLDTSAVSGQYIGSLGTVLKQELKRPILKILST